MRTSSTLVSVKNPWKIENDLHYLLPLERMRTYAGVPPSGAETNSWISHGRFLEVTLSITSINARWDHCVAKSKCSRLKYVTNSRMNILLVALVRRQRRAKESGQVLVHDHVLQTGNHCMASPLIDVLIAPVGVQALDSLGKSVVPPQE